MRPREETTEETTRNMTPDISPGQRRKIVFFAFIIAALNMICMFLTFAVIPYLAKKLGFDVLWFGYLQTTVGVVQLIGGPLFGRFADLIGARAALSLACSATVVSFLLLAIADRPAMLFIHKLPTIFMHVLPVTQMVVVDLSEPQKQAGALSKLNLCFGIGLIVGSPLGGTLSTRYGETFTACFGAVVAFASLILVLMFIPKSTKVQAPRSKPDDEKKNVSLFSLREITRLMKFPGVIPTFVVKTVAGLPSGIFQVMFSIIAMDFFKLIPEHNGYLMAYFGITQMVMQGAVIGQLTARYSDSLLLLVSVGVSALVGLGMAYMQNVFQFCLIVGPMMFSLSVFNVITDSILTKSVPSTDTGTMLGLCASVQSLLRTIGPTAGGFLYVNYGVSSFGFIQFVVNASVFLYLLHRYFKKNMQHQE